MNLSVCFRLLLLGGLLVRGFPLSAGVVRVEIDSRTLVLDGQAFGDAGAYELLQGRIYFALDPAHPANTAIVDLSLAPRNEAGMVEAWSDLFVLQAVDPNLRSGVGLVEVSNRGGKFSPRYFLRAGNGRLDPEDTLSFGDGLLLERGMSLIWIGWQWDVPEGEGLKLHVPVANYPDGSPIEGLVRSDWTVDVPTQTLRLGHRNLEGYPASDPQNSLNQLTRRRARLAEREVVADSLWAFAQWTDTGLVASRDYIFSADGFEAGYIYELVYQAKNPPVVGMGLAAIRDVIAYAKTDTTCPFPVSQGIAVGVSQTGRFLRMFLYQGFNQTEAGEKAYDGMMIITAGAGRGSFNHRFAQPSRDAHRYSAFFYPTDLFPFSSYPQRDSLATGGLLDRTPPLFLPKIFYINTGYEYWGRAAALIHTDLAGLQDVALRAEERVYHLASGQHYVGSFPPTEMEQDGPTAFRGNPLDYSGNYRALLLRLEDWVAGYRPPPASRYPSLGDGTLVPLERLRFPQLPGLAFPTVAHQAHRISYGPRWQGGWMFQGIIDFQPPVLGSAYPLRLPQLDRYGNELDGIRNVELRVPLATYFPWNVRQGMAGGNGELRDFQGTWVPFSRSETEAEDSGDPRPIISELYPSKAVYLRKVAGAIAELVSDGFLLPEDQAHVQARAELYWDWLMK